MPQLVLKKLLQTKSSEHPLYRYDFVRRAPTFAGTALALHG